MSRVFADGVVAYVQAGWPCILPVPAETKTPPPVGFTGADGRDTDAVQLVRWATELPDHSIALRMPEGVIGIDVDHYDKGVVAKRGADTLAAHVQRWGPLPATWCSTARGGDEPGPSRILFFRVPAGRYTTKLGPDIDVIQRHHRYAVVAPSVNHDAGGSPYRWYDPAGALAETVPKPDEFPELPAAWVAGLREGSTEAGPAAADYASGEALLAVLLADDRPACAEITSAALTALDELMRADQGSRHDTATARVHHLVQLGAGGHPGVGLALADVRERWETLTATEGREAEYERMLLTSARKAVTVVGRSPVPHDPCLLIGSFTVAAPAPADDRGDGAALPSVAPERPPFSIRAVIGVHAFDPVADLDQTLAQAVLERTYPAVRYAADARTWLRRGPDLWEPLGDLTSWSVSTVAELMPHGDASAEPGSDERKRATRRARLMTAGGAGAVASKIKAAVGGADHPCSLLLGQLDAEAHIIWAGGLPFDLRGCAETPTLAQLDPNTPHLHSAAVAPASIPTPLWDAFATAVWPDDDLRAWALRVLSIAFTGYCDAALPILLGETGRGKSQVITLLMSVLGTYAHAADPRLLGTADSSHASIVYALKGRRLSFVDEGPREGRWAQERLKQLTGGTELTGNRMRENPVTFAPTHTLVLTANEEPSLTDPAVRRRVRLIPCEGDPEAVRTTRAAIGHLTGAAWRAEAPGVLAAMMREAAAWLAEPDSALTAAAPEHARYLAEQMAAEQDPVRAWVEAETEPYEPGTKSRDLYQAFVRSARDSNTHPSRIPTETKWGRALTALGYPSTHDRDGWKRSLRVRIGSGWAPVWPAESVTGSPPDVTGRDGSDSEPVTDEKPSSDPISDSGSDGLTGLLNTYQPKNLNNPHIAIGDCSSPVIGSSPSTRHANPRQKPAELGERACDEFGQPDTTESSALTQNATQSDVSVTGAFSAQIFAGLVAARDAFKQHEPEPPAPVGYQTGRTAKGRVSVAKAEIKAREHLAAVKAAGGATVQLPASVDRAGSVIPLSLGDARRLLAEVLTRKGELTVDVEHTGYPIGHAEYALRTIQLGDAATVIVLDADDPDHSEVAQLALAAAPILHAHSATADLVPLAVAGVITDIDDAWSRMRDTVIPAKLADPVSTTSGADGLKDLAESVLREHATAPAADDARAALFKAGGWLKDTKVTTPVERSGWAQSDKRSEVMVRYAGSDVLDTGGLAAVLPWPAPDLLERELLAQRMTARVAYTGLPVDGDHVVELLARERPARDAAAEQVRAFGIDNPGSSKQIAEWLTAAGVTLKRTKPSKKFPEGQPSAAEGVLEALKPYVSGELGEFIDHVLDYREHDTAIGTFLEPYEQLVLHGDGRARPTVYTMEAKTGRMSCVRPNLQQVPRKGGYRACITADPGHLLISADFSGVEVRVAAALSQDPNLLHMVIEEDAGRFDGLHWLIARQVFGPEATKDDRYMVKRGVFGRLYGGGIPTLAAQVGTTESIAASMVDVLDDTTPGLTAWSQQVRNSVKAGRTQFPSYAGRVIHLRQPHAAPNYCIQGTARELLIDALIRWRQTKWGNCVILPVHDEIVAMVPEHEAEEATAALVTAMETEIYGVKIKADASVPSFAWADAS